MANMAKYKEFTENWKVYVKSDKAPTEEEWNTFFAQSNPVAGINWGVLSDTYTDTKGKKHVVYERQNIKNKWSDIKKEFIELYCLNDDGKIKEKLKNIKNSIIKMINSDRNREAAINRILVTLFPNKLLSIPGVAEVKRLAELLNVSDIDNKDWIDLCFEIKPELEKRYPNLMHWDAYRKLMLENNLTKNYNLILTGAPGTGKTYMAKQFAVNITRNNSDAKPQGNAENDFAMLKEKGYVEFVQFHPSYDYTDFVEGLRPSGNANSFKRMDGTFKAFCEKAVQAKKETQTENNKYVFIIDEINRGEISKIFGELFFSIDPSYRGKKGLVNTQYQNLILKGDFKGGFYVPDNVYIIGTMNDIDRSVESMDFAFRRRFSFYEVTAEDSKAMLWDGDNSKALENVMDRINNELIKPEYGLSEAYQIGAAYFNKIKKTEGKIKCDYIIELEDLWECQIKGLLFEYLRGKPNASNLLKQLEKAYFNKVQEESDFENGETQG